MEAKSIEWKQPFTEKSKDNIIEEAEDEEEEKKNGVVGGSNRRGSSGRYKASSASCQADSCGANLADSKRYHRRHKVCEFHSKAPVVMVAGMRQRFCQQCSRFRDIGEFDEVMRPRGAAGEDWLSIMTGGGKVMQKWELEQQVFSYQIKAKQFSSSRLSVFFHLLVSYLA